MIFKTSALKKKVIEGRAKDIILTYILKKIYLIYVLGFD